MTTETSATAREEALGRLAAYREARKRMPNDVRAALAAGCSQAEVARESGLSRQWVAKIERTSE